MTSSWHAILQSDGLSRKERRVICCAMSRHPLHASKQKQPPQKIIWWHIALPVFLLLLLFFAAVGAVNCFNSYAAPYATTPGKIVDIRKVPEGLINTGYGGRVFYRHEARVQFSLDGKPQDRWLRLTSNASPHMLDVKLAASPQQCTVYWRSDRPENARCDLP